VALAFLAWLGTQSAHAALTWDSTNRWYNAKRGETNAILSFTFANSSTNDVVIRAVRSSCHCTDPRMPFPLPGTLPPDGTGRMEVNIDLRERNQPFKQTITVETSAGVDQLFLDIQTPELTQREKDRLAAFADRQAVFKGRCADCHWRPAIGKSLPDQVKVLCGTCHDSPKRAEMVPLLAAKAQGHDRAYWDQWVRRGKPGTFMPAFGKPWGGPLSDAELQALVDCLTAQFQSPR
jgi:mono/diheme cytochrome c family protein